MKPKENTQCGRILARLERRKKRGLTQLEALNLDGVARLAAVVHTLRHSYGIEIISEPIEVRTRFGKARIARYRLGGAE